MTLVIGLPVSDGVVVASDSQVTTGTVRHQADKIYPLGEDVLWAGSGELSLIQRVKEKLSSADPSISLRGSGDQIALAIRAAVEYLLTLDFRTSFFKDNPDALLGLHPGDFFFAERAKGTTHLLHVMTHGATEWIENRPFAIGVGRDFAYALTAKISMQ